MAADFAIANGRFRDVPWQSFTARRSTRRRTSSLDTKLQQNESQWLTAKGELPMSLVRGQRNHDRIDLHVDSSTIDLGIIQGFTTAVTGVQGTLQAKLDMTGTALGATCRAAASRSREAPSKPKTPASPTKALDGKIDFLPDRVHIDDLHVLDNDNDSLSLTGDLGVAGLQLSNVNLGFYADNFKVLGNEIGNLHINSSLELTGTLANPKLQGNLGIATGNIKLDPILAKLTNSAYSTSAIDISKTQGPEDERAGIPWGARTGPARDDSGRPRGESR